MRAITLIFCSALFLGLSPVVAQAQTEQPKYKVIERIQGNVEVRLYGVRTVAQVEIPSTEERKTRSQAFRILAA